MASFRNVYTSLMLVIAKTTNKDLAREVSYLRVENQILRSKLPARISLTQKEKSRLVRFAKNLGSALNHLATIVHPGTIRRWIAESKKTLGKVKSKKTGRKRTAIDIEKLILKLASQNNWGYTRILGELKKIGVESVTRNTVKNILKRNGYETGPERGPGTWDEFLKIHASSLWQCDFFSKKVVSKTGLRDLFVLAFLHVETRRVYLSPASYNPNETWVLEQAAAFKKHAGEEKLPCKVLMHDRDTKFSKAFDAAFETSKIEVKKSAFRSPNTCAFIERFVQTIKQECLEHFIVFGRAHMNYLCDQFRQHYELERPHQSLENELPRRVKKSGRWNSKHPDVIRIGELHCKERLGGLLKHYSRKAA